VEGSSEFVALGKPGSEHYAGLETFLNPGVVVFGIPLVLAQRRFVRPTD